MGGGGSCRLREAIPRVRGHRLDDALRDGATWGDRQCGGAAGGAPRVAGGRVVVVRPA